MKKVLISFLKLFHLLIIIICFSLSFGEGWGEAFAQIVIEERVEISPEGINNILPTGSISGDDRNPVYLGYGGEVTLRLIHRTHNSYQLWEETLGQLTISGTTSIGTFPQWHKFIFYLLDPTTGNKYYPQPGDDIVWDWGSTIDFYPSHQPGDPYPYNPEDWWEIDIDVDYSLAAMPPQEILDYLGNPFAQSEPLEVPIAGSIYAIVYTYTNANDALWMDLPATQLIQDNLINHDGETFELGDMTAGDEIRFYLNSSNTIVSGSSLYPHSEVVEEPTPEGDVHLWTLFFENWTDLLFDDVEVEIYIRPEEPYPGNIAAIVEPEELAPGDTASITFKKRYLNGTLEDFPEWKTFEVGMVDGCDLGNLLVDGELAPYFYDAMQPVYFVADSSADTGTVKLQVALVEEIIGLRPVQNNFPNETYKQIKTEKPNQKGHFKEAISARRENRTKPFNENKKIYENVTPNNPENSSCPLLEFNNPSVSNFDFDVVGDGCDFENCENWNYNDVEVQLLRQLNGYEVLPDSFITICKLSDPKHPLGQSTSVPYERIRKDQSGNWDNSWNLLPCITPDEKIEFKIVDVDVPFPVPIYVDFLADVCYSIISNDGFTLINDTTELKDPNIVSNPQIIFNDICGHYCYPQVLTNNGYVLKEVINLHEQLHFSHYQEILEDYKNSLLIPSLSQFSYSCSEYTKFFNIIEEVASEVKSKIYSYVYETEVNYAQESGIEFKVGGTIVVQANPNQEKVNEKKIQGNDFLKKLIDDYHFALSRDRGTPYPVKTCQPCPI